MPPLGSERSRRVVRFARLMQRRDRVLGGPSARAASGGNLSRPSLPRRVASQEYRLSRARRCRRRRPSQPASHLMALEWTIGLIRPFHLEQRNPLTSLLASACSGTAGASPPWRGAPKTERSRSCPPRTLSPHEPDRCASPSPTTTPACGSPAAHRGGS